MNDDALSALRAIFGEDAVIEEIGMSRDTDGDGARAMMLGDKLAVFAATEGESTPTTCEGMIAGALLFHMATHKAKTTRTLAEQFMIFDAMVTRAKTLMLTNIHSAMHHEPPINLLEATSLSAYLRGCGQPDFQSFAHDDVTAYANGPLQEQMARDVELIQPMRDRAEAEQAAMAEGAKEAKH